MLFFVKVRIDVNRLAEFGQKLQRGEIETHPLSTYCLEDDPAVGLNIWEADDQEDFDKKFALHRPFYAEVMEVTPVITAGEAQKVLMEQLAAS